MSLKNFNDKIENQNKKSGGGFKGFDLVNLTQKPSKISTEEKKQEKGKVLVRKR